MGNLEASVEQRIKQWLEGVMTKKLKLKFDLY